MSELKHQIINVKRIQGITSSVYSLMSLQQNNLILTASVVAARVDAIFFSKV